MTEELKPCPFCGGKPERDFERAVENGVLGDIVSWSIYCKECYAEVHSFKSLKDVTE